jgi:acyl-coenzyme A thioesterase PaaI-like protein
VTDSDKLEAQLIAVLNERFRDSDTAMLIPPPVFRAMQARVAALDLDKGRLTIRFPVLQEQLNPFGNMQGGMVAAMIDNTLGPLSMAVAPPNFTRQFEVKYRRPVHPGMGHVFVTGRFVERRQRRLFFTATVSDDEGVELAVARSVHWIIETPDDT